MSVTASHCSTIQSGFRSRASFRIWSRNCPQLAKKRGASQRYTTMPGSSVASGYLAVLCHPPRSGTSPRTAPWGHQLRLKNRRTIRTMAMMIPWSTPNSMTPAVATRLTTNEDVSDPGEPPERAQVGE